MKNKLTPEAQELQDKWDKQKTCPVCDGKGVVFEQPYGLKTICFACKGTGLKGSL
jgi:DnaJ-class molecular chaperone